MKRKWNAWLPVLGSVLVMHSGCMNQIDNLRPDPTVAIPLAYGSLSAADIADTLKNTRAIHIDDEGFITLAFSASKKSKTAEEAIAIPDWTIPLLPMVTTYPVPPVQGVQIWAMEMKSGSLRIELRHPWPNAVQVTIESPSLRRNGTPFSFTATAPSHNGIVSLDTTVPLQGYHLTVGSPMPTITIQHSVLDLTTQAPLIPQSLKLGFEGIRFQYLEFTNALPIPLESVTDTLFVDILKDVEVGEFWMQDPSIDIALTNRVGGDVRVGFSNVVAYAEATNSQLTFLSPWPTLTIDMPPAPGRGDTSFYMHRIDSSNSNLREVLALLASEFRYTSMMTLLPSPSRKFVLDTSHIEVAATLNLPLYGYAALTLEKEWKTQPPSIDTSSIDSAVIYLLIENDFPLDVTLQAYFLDNTGHVFDSLFDAATQLIAPGVVTLDGRVMKRGRAFVTVPIGRHKLRRLQNLDKVRFRARVSLRDPSSASLKSVKVYDFYTIDVQISLVAHAKL